MSNSGSVCVEKLKVPERVGGRVQAAELSRGLPDGSAVELDFSSNELLTPSFIDELLRVLVVEQGRTDVRLSGTSARARDLAARVLVNRSIAAHVKFLDSSGND